MIQEAWSVGLSTSEADEVVLAMSMASISKSPCRPGAMADPAPQPVAEANSAMNNAKPMSWHTCLSGPASNSVALNEFAGRRNKEVMRRADVVGTFKNEDSIVRLAGAVLHDANYE
jgi:hypothetical protein